MIHPRSDESHLLVQLHGFPEFLRQLSKRNVASRSHDLDQLVSDGLNGISRPWL
jgi:hypothetical protein